MPDDESNIPEFDLFRRIEDLESTTRSLTEQLGSKQQTELAKWVADAYTLGLFANEVAFYALAKRDPRNARAIKDTLISAFRRSRASEATAQALESSILSICDAIDKK